MMKFATGSCAPAFIGMTTTTMMMIMMMPTMLMILLLSDPVEGFSFFQTAISSTISSISRDAAVAAAAASKKNSAVAELPTVGDEGRLFSSSMSRRDSFTSVIAIAGIGSVGAASTLIMSPPSPVSAAAPDCMGDCVKNCQIIAPKDPSYCTDSCTDYCAQDDRTDGLSGSVSAQNGEVGILGGSFGQGTVPKGKDKPPSIKLPFLDFNSGDGKKLLGY